MSKPLIYADFHNADSQGRLRLNCVGTLEDLSTQGIELREGLALTLYADDANEDGELDELRVDGIVQYSDEETCWVAAIDWTAIHHVSDEQAAAKPSSQVSPIRSDDANLTDSIERPV